VEHVLVELIFAPLYHVQSDPLEVMRFLQACQFQLVDFYEKVFDAEKLAWFTALFRKV